MLGSIGDDDLARWAQERVTAGTSGATVNRDLALYRWAQRMKYVDENPVRHVERFSEKGRERETYLVAARIRESP